MRAPLYVLALSFVWSSSLLAQTVSLEPDTDRRGNAFRSFDLNKPDANLCRQACATDAKCLAFTYIEPKSAGQRPRCLLMNAVAPARRSSCCTSGVRTIRAPSLAVVKPAVPRTAEAVAAARTLRVARPTRMAVALSREAQALEQRQQASRTTLQNTLTLARARPVPRIEPAAALQRYVVVAPPPARDMMARQQARRSPADLPRITGFRAQPAIVGADLTVRGERLGTTGRVLIDIAGLRLAPPVVSWAERLIVISLPAELSALVGERIQDARISIYADAGIATAGLQIGPDPATLVPVVRRVNPTVIEPGVVVTVEGERFLADPPGSAELSCATLGAVFPGEIVEWTATIIGVRFVPAISREVTGLGCDLVLHNHLGNQARRRVGLTVRVDTLELTSIERRVRQIFLERATTLHTWEDLRLTNGWLLRDTRLGWSDDGIGGYAEWRIRPTPGGTNTYAELNIDCRGRPGVHAGCPKPDGLPSEITYTIVIEGPMGAPYTAR